MESKMGAGGFNNVCVKKALKNERCVQRGEKYSGVWQYLKQGGKF